MTMPWGTRQQLQSGLPQTTGPYASGEWDTEWCFPVANKEECSHTWVGQRFKSWSATEVYAPGPAPLLATLSPIGWIHVRYSDILFLSLLTPVDNI